MQSTAEQIQKIRSYLQRAGSGFSVVQKPEHLPAAKRLSLTLRLWNQTFNTPQPLALETLSVAPFPIESAFIRFEGIMDELELYSKGTFVPNLAGHTSQLDSILKAYLHQLAGHLQDRRFEDPTASERQVLASMSQWVEGLSARLAAYEEVDEVRYEAEEAREAAELLRKKAEEVTERAGELRAAVGAEAGAELSVQFDGLAKKERTTADRFRYFTYLFAALGVGAAIYLHQLPLPADGELDPVDAIYNLAIVGGIFGFSGYLARQSGNHRQIAVWARTITVQLLEFDKFVEPVNDPMMRHQIRFAFANRAFGSPPTVKGEENSGPSPLTIDQVLTLVNRSPEAK